jgi:hypothetical protein
LLFDVTCDLIDKKDNKQLAISSIAAKPVESSIKVAELNLAIFIEVSTIKQKPSRLEEVFSICGDLFSTAIDFILYNKIILSACKKKIGQLMVGYLIKH